MSGTLYATPSPMSGSSIRSKGGVLRDSSVQSLGVKNLDGKVRPNIMAYASTLITKGFYSESRFSSITLHPDSSRENSRIYAKWSCTKFSQIRS